MKIDLPITIILIKLMTVNSQVPFIGNCPDVKPKQHFDVKKYLGRWYEQLRYFAVFEAGGICVTAEYTDKGSGVVGVNNTEYNTISGKYTSIRGEAKLSGAPGEGQLSVRFTSIGGFEAPYTVVDTDYTSFAVVWSCTSFFGVGNLQFAWILTREKYPDKETKDKINRVVASNHLSTRSFRHTEQTCENPVK